MNRLAYIAFTVAFWLLAANPLFSQKYVWPIDSTLPITGNYGELRPNHFHTGIDFSTLNKQNLPVYAIADGYVSRIRISSTGYGKSIYITHAGGKVSVYAHLNSFIEPFQKEVLNEMRTQLLYEKDWYITPNLWQVKRGQVIGRTGNTGGSTGPHLHFEIRDEQSEIPLNPLLFYKMKDAIAPQYHAIAYVELSDTLQPKLLRTVKMLPTKSESKAFKLPNYESPTSIIGIAFSANDQLKALGNANQVNGARLLVDGQLIYAHQFSALNFDNGRYVNEFSFRAGKDKFQKCYVPEYFPSGIYNTTNQRGRIQLLDTLWHEWTLVLMDEAGNESSVSGKIRTRKLSNFKSSDCTERFVNAGTSQAIVSQGIRLVIPENVLYSSTCLRVIDRIEKDAQFSILPGDLNLNSALQILVKAPKRMEAQREKIVIKNESNVLVPTWIGDTLSLSTKVLGKFVLQLDTIPPTLKAVFPKGKAALTAKQLKFTLRDQSSGISDFVLKINEQWTFAYFDAKNDVLILDLDETLPKGLLTIQLEAKDKCGNKSTLRTTFTN